MCITICVSFHLFHFAKTAMPKCKDNRPLRAEGRRVGNRTQHLDILLRETFEPRHPLWARLDSRISYFLIRRHTHCLLGGAHQLVALCIQPSGRCCQA
jgi:hypothetical protein